MDRKSVTGQAMVVGAGVMGAQIAAHLANAGWRATLLDIAFVDSHARWHRFESTYSLPAVNLHRIHQ